MIDVAWLYATDGTFPIIDQRKQVQKRHRLLATQCRRTNGTFSIIPSVVAALVRAIVGNECNLAGKLAENGPQRSPASRQVQPERSTDVSL